jgi:hypothetical protein
VMGTSESCARLEYRSMKTKKIECKLTDYKVL